MNRWLKRAWMYTVTIAMLIGLFPLPPAQANGLADGGATKTAVFESASAKKGRVGILSANDPNGPRTNLAAGAAAYLQDNYGNSLDPVFKEEPDKALKAANAVDGNPGTFAAAAGAYAWTLQIDLGELKPRIDTVKVTFAEQGYATQYEIWLSTDGDNWNKAADETYSLAEGQANGYYGKATEFAPTDARYVRIRAIKPDGEGQTGLQMTIAEAEVYASPETRENLAMGSTAFLQDNNGNSLNAVHWETPSIAAYASKAVDGNPNTAAQAAGSYAWTLQLDLGEVKQRIDNVKVKFAANGYATQYQIWLSANGTNWDKKADETYSLAEGQANDFYGKTTSFAPSDARYVRIRAIKPDDSGQEGLQMAIREAEIYAAPAPEPEPLQAITTTSSTDYMDFPETSIYPAFVDNMPYEAWTKAGKTSSYQLKTNGGTAPFQWSIVSGSLPDGLTLGADGKISGTPTTEGTFNFRVRVVDDISASVEKDLTMVANPYRTKWVTDAKFGVMVQWGAFTDPSMATKEEIAKFEERATAFDADVWCQAVQDMGGEILNFTVKAGDGIRLWPSTTRSQLGLFTKRDFTEELIEACHARGIKFVAYFAPDHTWNQKANDVSADDGTWSTLNVGLIEELIDKGVDGFWIDVSGTPELYQDAGVDPSWFPWDRILPLMRSKNPYLMFISNAGVQTGGTVLKWPDTDVINYEGPMYSNKLTVAEPNYTDKKVAVEVENMLDTEWGWFPNRWTPTPKTAQAVIESIQANWNNGATYLLNYPVDTEGHIIPDPYVNVLGDIGAWVKANQGWSTTPDTSLDERIQYTEPQDVELIAAPGAEIRYTTDGSLPTKLSPLYEAAIHLAESTRLRAISYEAGKGSSIVMDKSLVIVPDTDHSRTLATATTAPASEITEQSEVFRGMKITVGSEPITVDRIGRFAAQGNTGKHTLMIKRFADDKMIVKTQIDMSEGTADSDGFKYKRIVPVVLEPGKIYYVLSLENASDKRWNGNLADVKSDSAARIVGNISIPATGSTLPLIKDNIGQLINLKFTSKKTGPKSNLAFGKAAYLQDNEGGPLEPSTYVLYAENAVDGDPNTVAEAAWSWDWTLHVDLGKVEKGINKVVANFVNSNGTKLYATDYQILLSVDGTNWTLVAHDPNNTSLRSGATFAPTDARYVRFRALKPNGPDQPGIQMTISELEIYKNDLAYGSQAVMLDHDGNPTAAVSDGAEAFRAVDGDSDTAAQAAGSGDWMLQSDLGEVKTGINNVLVSFPQGKAPADWKVQLSVDGDNWTTVDTLGSFGGNRHSSVFAPVDARYIRIVSANVNASWALSSLEVYNDNMALGTSARMQDDNGNELGSSGFDPTKHVGSWAVDGNPDTFGIAGGVYAWTLQDDLGRVVQGVHGVSVMFPTNLFATQYQIWVSVDGVNWTLADSVSGIHGGGTYTSLFDPVDARYVRVKAIKPNDANQEGVEMAISELGVYAQTSDDAQIEFMERDYVSEYDQAPIVIRNMEDTGTTVTAAVYSDSVPNGINVVLTRQPDGSYRTLLGFSKTASGNGKLLVKDGDNIWVEYADIRDRIGEPKVFQSGKAVWRDSSAYDVSVAYRVGGTDNAAALQPGKLLDAAVTVTNRMADSKPVIVITALYDRNGAMVNVSYLSKTIQSLQTEVFHAGFLLPSNVNGHTVKTFVWDGTDLSNTLGIPYSAALLLPN